MLVLGENKERTRWKLTLQTGKPLSLYHTNRITKVWIDAYNELSHRPNFNDFTQIQHCKLLKWIKATTPNLTIETQSAALKLLNIDNVVTKYLNDLKIRKRIRNFLWEMYSSKLPIIKNNKCNLCKLTTSGNHLLRCTFCNNLFLHNFFKRIVPEYWNMTG